MNSAVKTPRKPKGMSASARVKLASFGFLPLSMALLLGGCTTDTPSEPRQNPQPPSNQASAVWNITVTANPASLNAGSAFPSTITIIVRNASNNQPPPNGSTLGVSTTLGEFNSQGSGEQSGGVTLLEGQAVLTLFAGDFSGQATIRAELEGSTGFASVEILAPLNFLLERVVPNFGHPSGGELVSIFGGGFVPPVRVTFNNILADVQSVTSTRIDVLTPAIELTVGSTQLVTINVINNAGGEQEDNDSLPSAFTYSFGAATGPQIFSISPNSGPNEGGTRVVINGVGFENPVQVMFGQGSAGSFSGVEAQVESVTASEIIAISPAATAFGQENLNSVVSILVRNQNSGLATVQSSAFEYGVPVFITSIGPNVGPSFGGQLVTLFGQGFDEPVAVTLAGFGASVISVTGTEILVRSSAISVTGCPAEVTGPSEVVNIETGDSATGPNYIYRVAAFGPRVNGVSPNSGPAGGGTSVTITGSNFSDFVEVTFDDRPAAITSLSPSAVTVSAPFQPDSAFTMEACDSNNDGMANGMQFVPLAVDVTVTDSVNGCASTFTDAFVYNPPSNACVGDFVPPPTTPGMPPVASFTTIAQAPFIQFNDTSTNTPTMWQWDIGNNGSVESTAQNPLIDMTPFGMSGQMIFVSLTVSNADGQDQVVQQVTIP